MQKESGLETETMLATILHWTWSLHSKWNKFKDPSNSITYTAMNLIMFDLNPVKGRLIHVALSESGTVAITHLLLQLRIHQWSQWRIMMVLCKSRALRSPASSNKGLSQGFIPGTCHKCPVVPCTSSVMLKLLWLSDDWSHLWEYPFIRFSIQDTPWQRISRYSIVTVDHTEDIMYHTEDIH